VGSGQAKCVAQRQQHTHTPLAAWDVRHTVSNAGSQWAVGRPATPSPSLRNLLLWGRRLNCQPATCIPALPHLTRGRVRGGSVCMLLPSIWISLVVVSVRYHRCSHSHDIIAMCGWRSISWYRLIDIIPTTATAATTATTTAAGVTFHLTGQLFGSYSKSGWSTTTTKHFSGHQKQSNFKSFSVHTPIIGWKKQN